LDAIEHWQQRNDDFPFKKMLADSVRESLDTYIDTIKNNVIWK